MTDDQVERVARAIRTYGTRIWGASHLYAVIKCIEWDKPIIEGLSAERANEEAAVLNAFAAIAAMSAPEDSWRDIASAPDGGMILVYEPRNKPEFAIEMRRSDGDFWRWMLRDGSTPPTHWRPLPAPPKGTQDGQ
jgi:hypothetical protein